MNKRELEQFVNQLAKQHQELVERVNDLEVKQRASVGHRLLLDEENRRRINRAFCGSQ